MGINCKEILILQPSLRIPPNKPLIIPMKKYLILMLCAYSLPSLLNAQDKINSQYAAVFLGEKKGCIDGNGKIIIPVEYDFIYPYTEGLAVVNKGGAYDENYYFVGGLYGYFDQNGKLAIPISYEDASNFSEGLARVKKNGKFGFINQQNQTIIPFQYEEVESFSDGLAIVKIKEKYGAIDQTGKLVIPAVYDEINDFNEGYAAVYHFQKMVVDEEYGSSYRKGKYGLINKSNELVVDTIYDFVGYFEEGMAKVRKEEKIGVIDGQGKLIIPIEYEEISTFSEGLAIVGKYIDENELDYRYGFINKKGELVIDFKFTYAYEFNQGIAMVERDFSGTSYNLIDKTGKILLDKNYYDISELSQDSTYLLQNEDYAGGAYKIGTGRLTPTGYQDLNYLGNGFFYVEETDNGDGAIISKNQIAKIASYFINIEAGISDHFIAEVITDTKSDLITKMGIINSKGQWIVEPKYDSIGRFAPFK